MNTFTLIHVLISLVGIGSGFVVVGGWLAARHLPGWAVVFLATTAATSLTGFFFPFNGITPGIVVGILSLLVLAVALFAWLSKARMGRWELVYAISGTVALYFNCFVLIAQSFRHTPPLRALAPTESELPFALSQLLVLILFIVLGAAVVRRLLSTRLTAGN